MIVIWIWVAVWAILALIHGYFFSQKKKEDDFDPSAIVFVFWPIFLLIATLSSPIWIPISLSEAGYWLRRRKERKRAVNNFIKTLPPDKK